MTNPWSLVGFLMGCLVTWVGFYHGDGLTTLVGLTAVIISLCLAAMAR